jgi:hypothetical protein
MLAGGMDDYLVSACSSSTGTRTRRPPGGTAVSVSTPAPSSPVVAADDASRAAAVAKRV